MRRPLRVTFLAEEGADPKAASAAYRCYLPAAGLAAHGVACSVTNRVAQLPTGRLCGISLHNGALLEEPDVLICRQPTGDVTSFFTDARLRGQRVYIDLDDDLWNARIDSAGVPLEHPVVSIDNEQLAVLEKNIGAANGVFCSTPAIAETVRSRVIGTRCFEAPPAMPPFDPAVVVAHTPIRLGWMGRVDFRGADLAWYRDELVEVLKKFHKPVEFWHIGAPPPGSVGVPDVAQVLGDFPAKIHRVGWVPFIDLGIALSLVDVLIHPQEPGRWNEARSATTGMAAATVGIPFAFTETGPYREAFGDSPELGELLSSSRARHLARARARTAVGRRAPRIIARCYLEAFDGA